MGWLVLTSCMNGETILRSKVKGQGHWEQNVEIVFAHYIR